MPQTDAAILTKATESHTSVMVAFYLAPFIADALVTATDGVRGVQPQPVDELHCTLALYGTTDELAQAKYQLLAGVERYARYASAVIGTISGTGRFGTTEADETHAFYASVDAPNLHAWRDNLVQTLADTSGMLPMSTHGYTPHITLAYIPTTSRTPTLTLPSIPVLFDTISVAWGDERYDFPLVASSPMVFKDTANRSRWITFSSSSFRDRDQEIVSTKALEDDVARADASGEYGPLRFWHQPGFDIGDCDFNAMADRILVESGTFRSEAIAERIKAAAPTMQVSIGFLHPATQPDADGVFTTIQRFERSLLPSGYASNLFTQLLVEGDPQPMDETKKAAARALFGDEVFDKLMVAAEQTQKSADAAGIAFKAAPSTPPAKETAPAAAAPATAEAADADAADAVGDMNVEEFTAVVKAANQPMVDVLTALVNAVTGTSQQAAQTATKDVAIDARLTAAEQDVVTLKAKLATAEAQVTELRGDLPASIASRRASQSTATLLPTGTAAKAADFPAADTGFLGFITGEQPQQGA